MKNLIRILMIGVLIGAGELAMGQNNRSLQFFRPVGQDGLNVFETPKVDTVEYDGIKVRVGGDFAMQFQGIDHSNTAGNLIDLGSDFNLPTANLNLDVQLYDGVRMHLRTYLSSKHHNEAWIKGGHMQIDKLDFISEGFLEGLMQYTSITVGLDEFNYGDAHFRRTDNARAIYNPFVGNYIMDAFSTEAFGEITLQTNGLLAVVGVTNGKLNQNVSLNANSDNQPSFYGKVGYDQQLNEDFRLRLTGSWYINNGTTTGTYLYGGDRAGSRYYNIMKTEAIEADPDNGIVAVPSQATNFDGRFNPRFGKLTAIQVNPFIKFKGLEFFGIYELANGNNEFTAPTADTEGAFTQIAAELLYRFGANERYYIGGRYNTVNGKLRESATEDLNISRLNVGAGWFLTNNIITKLEYVNQQYNGDGWVGNNARFAGGEFKGFMVEAAISF
ncbi:hypothetical protein JKA74_10810 [Marivirga sp. S37H4]|uniref:Porin n=1 Tax=Marivirga aurantiaca TaxID=2802615 RepID=A0A935CBS2_9BACT|nr:hypothetical protein [Marivirga aurantiaca]MBK6265528.1 hypothetical protein [Marivirga aurantiaca]